MTRQEKKRAEEEAEKEKLAASTAGQEDAEMVGADGEDYDDEDDDLDEDDDEGLSSEEVSEGVEGEGEGDGSMTDDLKRRRKAAFKKEQKIANRALRIKMGKSGAQAATRKNIKKGKDACQRKLWG